MAQSEVFHIKAIADFSQPEKEAARIRTKLDREINSAFRNMEKSFGQPLGHITGRMDEFASSLEASNARVIAFGASAGIVYQVSKAFRELVKNTIDVEKSMADIQVVLNANTKQLERYRSGIFNIAKQTGQSFSEVSKAATELARQGLDAEKTLVRLKDALVLSRLSGMDTLDSVEALTAAINGFGETVVNSTALVNKFATVDQKFAVSSQDLAEAFKRVGSTAVDAGVSIDELIALVTSAQQITARGGSVIGNSFKTIFTRVQRPQVLQDLEEAGIKVKNFSGESLKAVDILTNLAKSYDTLSSSQKSFVSEAVGGVFQINVLKALLKDIDGDFSIFSRALDASATASDAAAKKNELLNKTLDSLINKSVENLREFSVVLGEVTVKPIIVKTLSAINSVVETIVKNKEGLGTVLDIIGKFVSGPVFGLIAGSLIRLFAGFSKYALQAGAQIAGLTKRQEDVARIQNLINNLLISQPELYKQIQTGAISVEQAEKRVLNILRQQSAERAKMMQFSSGAASTVFASGVRVDTKKKTLTGAGIPNLANPLREAIQREVGSGIPKSAIRIGSDSRLASSSNPSGIGVYNTIDEPMGIGQGISRSQRMGINPKTAGIPNFAVSKKRIYNPETGRFESLIVDDQSGRLTDPKTGRIVGNLFDPQSSSVADPRKGKFRDRYQEKQNQTQREARVQRLRAAAREAADIQLYGQGLRKDPLMLPFSTLSNIPYSSSASGSVGGLASSKGKTRDRYAEYVENLRPSFILPQSISQFPSIKYSEKRASTGEIPIIGGTTSSGMVVIPQTGGGSLQGPNLPLSNIITSGPSDEEKRLREARIKAEKEVEATRKRFSTAETGYTDADVKAGQTAVRQKSMAKEFAKEFEKVLLDPKISDAEKKATIDAVSKGLDKAGTFVSVKRVGELLNPEFKQETFRKFLKDYENTNLQFDKKQADRLQKTIYEAGFGGKATPLLQAGSVGYRRPTSLFKTEQDIATGQFYAVSEKTGKRTPVSEGVARRIQKQNEILSKTLEPYILSDKEIQDRAARMSKLDAPLGVGQSIFADSKRKSTILSDRAELIKQIRNINPNVSISVASKLADYQIKTGIDVVGQTKQHLASQPSPSKAAGVGLVDLSGNKRFRSSLSPSYYSSFPTFSRMFSGSGKTGANGGMYQRLRNMDPMNKMMLLSGVGMLGSIGSSYIERSAMEDQSLTGMQKKNRSLLAGTIGSTLTGAMLGGSLTAGTGIGMLGGAAIGGIVAAAFSIGDVLKNWNDILPDLQINLEKTSRKIQEMNETSQGVSSVLFKLANPPEFKSEAERNKYVRETESEFKKEMSRRGISGPSRAAVYSEIGSGKSLEEIIANIQKIFASETKKLEPTLALQELTTGIIKSQRENVDMEFGPLLSQIRSQRFGTLGEARGKMSKEAADSINDTIQQILGKINTITTPQRGIVGSNMGVPIYGEITDPSKLRILKSPEIVKMTEGLLQNAGLDKTSEEYQKLILSLSKSLEDGTSSLESFIFALKNIIPRSVEKANTSLEKLFENALKASQTRITEDLYGRGLRGSESIRESRLELVRRSVERQRSLSNIQFNQEKDIFGLQTTPITPTQRSLREISIKRSAERSALPFKTNELRDQMIGNLLSARGEAISMLSQEDASLQQIEVGKELDDLYGKLLENVRSGNLKEVEDEIYHTLGIFQDQLTKTDSAIHKNAINSLSELNQSFASYEGQILSLSEALRQSEELESKREELLRKQLDPRFATGDFYRSESATRNAIRRAQEGSDASTEITSSFRAFREEMGYTVNDFYTDFENSARDAAQTFKSEFKSAFNDFRRGSIDAGEALRQFAINVLDRIATNASNMAIDSLLNAAFGGASNIFANVRKSRTGGMVRKRYADGGMVTGGSGVVDDVPALLTSGEMVINREAVRTYGADYFNKINQGRGARSKLENRFLYLDDKGNISSSPTQGEARVSAALSNIGATNELMRANTDRFSREQRFVAYVQQRRAYNEQRSQAMKRYEKGIRQQAIAAGVSAGIGIGGSAIGSYFDNRNFANNAINSYQFPSSSTSTSYGPALPPSQGVIGFKSSNSGSIVPNFGSSNRDNIPYSLTGGEAVLRKEAVSMYGQQFVKDLNNGQVKTMRFGSQQSGSDVYSDLRNLPSSIDRLSSAITNLENRSSNSQDMNPNGGINNEFTFNIEIKSDSGNVSVQSGNMEQDKSGSGASEQDMKKIGEAVKGVVEQSISANLRPGGQIYNAIRRR